jgi:hypothetical protein
MRNFPYRPNVWINTAAVPNRQFLEECYNRCSVPLDSHRGRVAQLAEQLTLNQ